MNNMNNNQKQNFGNYGRDPKQNSSFVNTSQNANGKEEVVNKGNTNQKSLVNKVKDNVFKLVIGLLIVYAGYVYITNSGLLTESKNKQRYEQVKGSAINEIVKKRLDAQDISDKLKAEELCVKNLTFDNNPDFAKAQETCKTAEIVKDK